MVDSQPIPVPAPNPEATRFAPSSQSWSRCSAEKWVPALLEGVWMRVSATSPGSEKPRRDSWL